MVAALRRRPQPALPAAQPGEAVLYIILPVMAWAGGTWWPPCCQRPVRPSIHVARTMCASTGGIGHRGRRAGLAVQTSMGCETVLGSVKSGFGAGLRPPEVG